MASTAVEPRFSEAALLAAMWATVGISLVFVAARLGVRLRIAGNLATDDAFVLIAWVITLANTCLWTIIYKDMYSTINISVDLSHGLFPAEINLHAIRRYLRGQLAQYILGYSALWAVKLAFMFYFHNLGARIRSQTVVWWLAMVFIVLSWGTVVGFLEYKCLTSSGLNIIKQCASDYSTRYANLGVIVSTVLDIATDVALIVVSTNILWRAKIDTMKKLGLFGVFSLIGCIIAVAIIRIVVGSSPKGVNVPWLIVWNSAEICVAIIVACLVSFRKLYVMARARGRQQPPAPFFGHSIGGGRYGGRLLRLKRMPPGTGLLSTNGGFNGEDTQTTLTGIHVQHDIQTRSSPTTTMTETAGRSTYIGSYYGPSP